MEFKINPTDFRKIIELVRGNAQDIDVLAKNVNLNNDCTIVVSQNGIRIKAIDRMSAVFLDVYFETPTVTEGIVSIGNLDEFIDVLKRFENSAIITIDASNEHIGIKAERKIAKFPLISKGAIDSSRGAEDLSKKYMFENGFVRTEKTIFDTKVKLNAEEIKDCIADEKIVKYRKFPLIVSGGKLIVRVGDERLGFIEKEILPIEIIGEAKSIYAHGFENVFMYLEGEIEIYFATNKPLIIHQKSDKKRVFIAISPTVE